MPSEIKRISTRQLLLIVIKKFLHKLYEKILLLHNIVRIQMDTKAFIKQKKKKNTFTNTEPSGHLIRYDNVQMNNLLDFSFIIFYILKIKINSL